MVEQDLVECVLGLGPNLFYNSPMEACIVICSQERPTARKGKVLFIDAVNEVTRERAQSFLKPEHQERILNCFLAFAVEEGFSAVATIREIQANNSSLGIQHYVLPGPAKSSCTAGSPPETLDSDGGSETG